VFTGSGAVRYAADIRHVLGSGAHIAPASFSAPRAAVLARLAADRYRPDASCTPGNLMPGYIREPDARPPGPAAGA
jgi:hypothetical protein